VRRLFLGVLIGWLAAALKPKVGDGSGSDDAGDYNYTWARFRFPGLSIELHWWPE